WLLGHRLGDCWRDYESTGIIATARSSSGAAGAGYRDARAAVGHVLARATQVDPRAVATLTEREVIDAIAQDRNDAVRAQKATHDRLRYYEAVLAFRRVL